MSFLAMALPSFARGFHRCHAQMHTVRFSDFRLYCSVTLPFWFSGSISKGARGAPPDSSGGGGANMDLTELKEIVLHQREVERVDLALVAQRVPHLESLSIANYGVSNFAGATQYFRNVRGLRLRCVERLA